MTDSLLLLIHTLVHWDTLATIWLNGGHTDYWDNFMEICTGRFVWIPFYASLVYLMYKKFGWKDASVFFILAILLLVLNDQTSSSVIRQAVCRLRPANLDNPISSVIQIVDGYRGGKYGFPSAHAANSWGLVFLMIYLFRQRSLSVLMVLWALLQCYTRLYLGVHYVGDLLAGALLGLLNATLVCFTLWWYVRNFAQRYRATSVSQFTKYIPITVCVFSVVVMLILASFYDPSIGL